MRVLATAAALFLALACRSPLAELPRQDPPALAIASVSVEDHSRQLKRLRAVSGGETNSPEARRAALEGHRAWFDAFVRKESAARGIRLADPAPLRLELAHTSLGEVRGRYIAYGIASGVAFGVVTGLLAHNATLAVGLGLYELLEESLFWIAGSELFGGAFAPVEVEAKLFRAGDPKAVWSESYYVLSGRKWTKGLDEAHRKDRGVQLRASLEEAVGRLLRDLARIPGFPAPSPTGTLARVPAFE